MPKLRLVAILLAVLLAAAPLQGVCQAQDTYTIQYITTIAGPINYLGFVQGISGFVLPSFNDSGLVTVNFNNVAVSGVYNRNIGIGSFRNLGSVALVNIQPNQDVTPVIYNGQMFSQGNQIKSGDFNYGINLNFNNFRASGIVVLNIMAGSFCNQFTSLTFNMGQNAVATPSKNILSVTQGNPTVVSLTNQQMKSIAATADNDIQTQGKQTAVVSMQGAPNVQGVAALTMSAGINNQVSHHVEVNIDTRR
jgi:hypothetical protein